jgi:hypothetical protein
VRRPVGLLIAGNRVIGGNPDGAPLCQLHEGVADFVDGERSAASREAGKPLPTS